MIIGILAILSAVVLSIVSAVFSISGIITIFSGAVIGAGIMGATLEFSKIVSTVWLYSWWKKSSQLLRGYLVFAVVVLVFISSVGIYGYLARSFVGQRTPSQEIQNRVGRIELNIDREQRTIDRNESALDVLDRSIEQYLSFDAISLGLQRRDEQQHERQQLIEEIDSALDSIDGYRDELFELQNRLDQHSVDVGPIEYIAVLIYGEEDADQNYDNAVRMLIILLVLVFDPFAVLLMVAGNITIDKETQRRKRLRGKNKTDTPAKKPTKRKTAKAKPKPRKVPATKNTRKETKDIENPSPEPKTESVPERKKKVVEIDMSDYVDSIEIKELKERTEHRPLRRKPEES